MPHTYMVAVSPAATGRTCWSALSKRRNGVPTPVSCGTVGAGHDCMAPTLGCAFRSASDGGCSQCGTTGGADPFPSGSKHRSNGLEQGVRQLRPAHHEVGQIWVRLVVAKG